MVYVFTDAGCKIVKDVKLARTAIGRSVRRLRSERALSQQALATRLGISASYLNLIEHDQRAVTASLLIKLAETLRVDLGELSGNQERQLELGLREALSDPLLGGDAAPEAEIAAMAAASPNAARGVLALYRAWRVAREDASGIALPSGRRVLLPNEEARDFFDDHANHFADLEAAAETISLALGRVAPAEMNHAIAERLRQVHGLTVVVTALEGALRRYDPATRGLTLSETLPRESRGFHMAFQLVLMEAREAVETLVRTAQPTSRSGDADPHWAVELYRRRLADAVRGVPGSRSIVTARHGSPGVAVWRVFRAGVQPIVDAATTRRPWGAVLLLAGRPGGQCIEALRCGGLSVCTIRRVMSALDRA